MCRTDVRCYGVVMGIFENSRHDFSTKKRCGGLDPFECRMDSQRLGKSAEMKVKHIAASIYDRIMSTRVDELAKKCAFDRLESLFDKPFSKDRAEELANCVKLLVFMGMPKLALKAIQCGADPFIEPHERTRGGVLRSLIQLGHWEEASTFVEQFSSGESSAAWQKWNKNVSFGAVAAASIRYAQALRCSRPPSEGEPPHDKGFDEALAFLDKLKKSGVDMDGADPGGLRALHHAAGYPTSFDDPTCLSICGTQLPRPYASPLLCAKLLSLGADANAISGHGMKTPLMCAALSLSIDSMQALLDAGADILALDANGNGVAHYAAWGFRMAEPQARSALFEKTLALICVNGASLARPNNAGHCPFHFVEDENRRSELDLHCRRSTPARPEDISAFARVASEQEGRAISDSLGLGVVMKKRARL